MKKIITSLILFLCCFFAKAQNNLTTYFTINGGYEFWNGNYANIGANAYLVQDNNNIITIGAKANLGYMQQKFRILPEASIGYLFNFKGNKLDPYSSNINSSFYVTRVDISPWTITPKIGFSVLSLIEISGGYSFEFNKYKNFKDLNGFRIGLTFHVPIL